MKAIPISLSPTRSRALNLFLGLALALASVLLFLSLATYHSTDPSMNTSADLVMPRVIRNWVGLFGAGLSDMMLQALGVSAFLLPLWIGGLAWSWMRSRSGGSVWLRAVGTLLAVVFVPAVFGLLPWHWHWQHAVPVEGVIGRIVAGSLAVYLNLQGAWLVAGVLAVAGVYFAFAVSFWAVKQFAEDRWIQLMALHDRWRNWRDDRAEAKAEREAVLAEQQAPGPSQRLFTGSIDAQADEALDSPEKRRFNLWDLLRRRTKSEAPDPVDEIPAFKRAAAQPVEMAQAPEIKARRASIWERTATEAAPATAGPVPVGFAPAPAAVKASVVSLRPVEARAEVKPVAAPVRSVPTPAPPTPVPAAAESIAIHERADADHTHGHGGSQARERIQAAAEHAAECRHGPAGGARRRTAR